MNQHLAGLDAALAAAIDDMTWTLLQLGQAAGHAGVEPLANEACSAVLQAQQCLVRVREAVSSTSRPTGEYPAPSLGPLDLA